MGNEENLLSICRLGVWYVEHGYKNAEGTCTGLILIKATTSVTQPGCQTLTRPTYIISLGRDKGMWKYTEVFARVDEGADYYMQYLTSIADIF